MTDDAYERFRRDYAPAFLQYLTERGEPGRRTAYELGRRAMREQLSILDLAGIHHTVLLGVLKTHRTPGELEQIAQAASEFLVEALAVVEMTQRGYADLLTADRSDQEQRRQVEEELERRTVIDQATGVLMERYGLAAEPAAERIRQLATRQGVPAGEVAAGLVNDRPPGAERRPSR